MFGPIEGSLFGTPVKDVNGDNKDDLAFTTVDGQAVLVDGSNGQPMFEEQINGLGGPVAYVPGQGREPGTIVASSFDLTKFDSTAYAFSTEGNAMGTFDLGGSVHDIVAAEWQRTPGVAIVSGRDIYGFDLMPASGGQTRGGQTSGRGPTSRD
jgi:hypothetical protein